MADRKLISVLIPVFNEEANVRNAYQRVKAVFDTLPEYAFEIVFTDNASEDQTFQVLQQLAAEDDRVRVARFSRNFGFNRSVLTAYRLARGDAAMQLDCDLQDPPELLTDFLKLWEAGHDVVVGVRRKRTEARWLQAARKLFYRILHSVSDDNMVEDGGDFRLVDRSVIERLRWVEDAEPYTRMLTSLFARNQIGVPYDRSERVAGSSKFPLSKLIGLAIEGFLAHSTAPLRLASIFGLGVAVLTLLLSVFYIVMRLFTDMAQPAGFTTTTVLILLGMALNAIFLGIIGEYLGRIYNQMRRRPLTVIADAVNLDPVGPHEVEATNWSHTMPPARPEVGDG
jgi:dolichol-phosphate mannosyltransferase